MAQTTSAITILAPKQGAGITTVPIPHLRPDWVLVDVKAIALNPSDWKKIDYGAADEGARVGCDYAGVVREVGSGVTKFKKGDRIAGPVHGADRTNHENGAFADVITAKAALQFLIPANLSFEDAATMGVALITIAQGLYQSLQLPLPGAPAKENHSVLIYAASTSVGMYGVQFAKASGLTVIATSSLRNFDMLKALGADAVFDYSSPSCARDIKQLTGNTLRYSWDCMGTGAEICAAAMSDSGSPCFYSTINPPEEKSVVAMKEINPNVGDACFTLGYHLFGDFFVFMKKEIQPDPKDLWYAAEFIDRAQGLLAEGKIKPIQTVVNKGGNGLEGALKGLDELRAGTISGAKLVYTL